MAAASPSCLIKVTYFLRDNDLLRAHCRAFTTIAMTSVIDLKDVYDDATSASILVGHEQTRTTIEVGTASQPQYD